MAHQGGNFGEQSQTNNNAVGGGGNGDEDFNLDDLNFDPAAVIGDTENPDLSVSSKKTNRFYF